MMGNEFNQLAISGADAVPEISVNQAPELLHPERRSHLWRWMLLGLTACGVSGGMAISALISLLSLPPAPDCQNLTTLSPDMERLYCAQEAARTGELPHLLAGLDVLGQWTPAHPLYNEAQRSLKDWSTQVLAIARRKVADSDLKGALDLVKRIPPSSPAYQEAQAVAKEWQDYWQQGEKIAIAAQAAMKAQDWAGVELQIQAMREMTQDYWRLDQANALTQQLLLEQQARKTLAEAVKLAQTGQPGPMGTAIALVSRVDQSTHTWKELQPKLHQWSDALLSFGFQQWQQGNLDQAIAAAQRVLLNPALAEEAQNLVRLSQARRLAWLGYTTWEPTPKHLVSLMEAIAAAQKIPTSSRFYQDAQAGLKHWQAQLEDLQTLQVAQMSAALGQPATLKLAIAQAKGIAADSPRRLQTQTLVAHWSQEIERKEDAPILAVARRMAQPATIPALKAAIEQAKLVSYKRALAPEANTLIAGWTAQIQTIEDQPILDQARAAARRGRLGEAIQLASGIVEGRALYGQAQRAINTWRAAIRRAELARIRAQQEAARAAEQRLRESQRDVPLPSTTWGAAQDPPASAWTDPAPSVPRYSAPTPQPPAVNYREAPVPSPLVEPPQRVEVPPPVLQEPPRIEAPPPVIEVPPPVPPAPSIESSVPTQDPVALL